MPWTLTADAHAATHTVTALVNSWDDIQPYINAAQGPTVIVVKAATSKLSATRSLIIDHPVTLTTSKQYFDDKAADTVSHSLIVNCQLAKSVLRIRYAAVAGFQCRSTFRNIVAYAHQQAG